MSPSRTSNITPIRVRIVSKDHPHYPETGELTGEIIRTVYKTDMAYLKLDACRHGTEGCYVGKGEVAPLQSLCDTKPPACEHTICFEHYRDSV